MLNLILNMIMFVNMVCNLNIKEMKWVFLFLFGEKSLIIVLQILCVVNTVIVLIHYLGWNVPVHFCLVVFFATDVCISCVFIATREVYLSLFFIHKHINIVRYVGKSRFLKITKHSTIHTITFTNLSKIKNHKQLNEMIF